MGSSDSQGQGRFRHGLLGEVELTETGTLRAWFKPVPAKNFETWQARLKMLGDN
jgi:hypothetical protein